MSQVTTLTFFRFKSFKNKWWALRMMRYAHPYLKDIPGQQSYKLMGSGKNDGFHPLPDWGVYTLLQIWDSEGAADQFFHYSELMQKYLHRSKERWTIFLRNIQVRGQWDSQKLFQKSEELDNHIPLLASITRATIKPRHLFAFWKYVPNTSSSLRQASGLVFAKGIAEFPILQIATFSIWENGKALKSFAHQSRAHRGAIRKTADLNWYAEELFARFQPFRTIGTWGGQDLFTE